MTIALVPGPVASHAVVGQLRFVAATCNLEIWDGVSWKAIPPMYGPEKPWPTMDWFCSFLTPHEVVFHVDHPVRENSDDVIMWALMNCDGLYRFYSHRTPEAYRVPEPSMDEQRAAWLWQFTDANDAFHFKMRWL